MIRPAAVIAVVVAATTLGAALARPSAARAFNLGGALCEGSGLLSGVLGRACNVVTHGGRILSAGRKLVAGHVGQAIDALTGASSTVHRAVAVAGLAAIAATAVSGARYALNETATVVSATTQPALTSAWFGGAYWRIAAIALLLTVPLLLVAVAQAIIRSDLGLLARSAFGFLPLSGLAVGLAVPLTVLLLQGSDEMAALVSDGHPSTLLGDAVLASGLTMVLTHSVFLGFLLALITCAMTLALWLELAIRQAAVTVIVLMLPLFFAAIVWPARRIWAVRAVELLVSLVLSKFVIVAVLKVGAAAMSHSLLPGAAAILTGVTLVMLAAFSPWALLRILPLHELAAGAVGGLTAPVREHLSQRRQRADGYAASIEGDDEDDGVPPAGVSSTPAVAAADATDALLADDQPMAGTGGLTGPASTGGGGGGTPPAGGGARTTGTPPGEPVPDPTAWMDDALRRPRPGSDVDPIVHAAPNFGWRPIDLDLDEVLSEEPLIPPGQRPFEPPAEEPGGGEPPSEPPPDPPEEER